MVRRSSGGSSPGAAWPLYSLRRTGQWRRRRRRGGKCYSAGLQSPSPARPHETGDWAASGPATAEEEEVGEEEARAELEEERPAPTVLCGVAARQPTRQPCGT